MRSGNIYYLTNIDLKPEYVDENFEFVSISSFPEIILTESRKYDVIIYSDDRLNLSKILKNRFSNSEIKDGLFDLTTVTKLKMLWFSTWLTINYEGFLNEQTSDWFIEKIGYFNDHIFPTMLLESTENGNLDITLKKISEFY